MKERGEVMENHLPKQCVWRKCSAMNHGDESRHVPLYAYAHAQVHKAVRDIARILIRITMFNYSG